MKLVLIRHAEMTGGPFLKPDPDTVSGCLSEAGVIQAQKLADAFNNERLDIIYCSPFGRALQTAKILAGASGKITVLDFLHEWLPNPELDRMPPEHARELIERTNNLCPDETWKTELGEGVFEMFNRIGPPFLEELRKSGIHRRSSGYVLDDKAQDLTIAVVAHGGSLGVLTSFLLNLPPSPVSLFEFELTGVLEIRFHQRGGAYYPKIICPPQKYRGSL